MEPRTYGQMLVRKHLEEMTGLSRKQWPPIIERDGFEIVSDRAYQGFDNDPACQHRRFCGHFPEWYPEPRFWCRIIHVQRISDGRMGWGVGPQNEAYETAVQRIEESSQ